MAARAYCATLDRIQVEILNLFQQTRKIRRSKDLSLAEDAALTRSEHKKIDELVRHLLAGHGGKPCPAGDRPIVGGSKRAELFRNNPAA